MGDTVFFCLLKRISRGLRRGDLFLHCFNTCGAQVLAPPQQSSGHQDFIRIRFIAILTTSEVTIPHTVPKRYLSNNPGLVICSLAIFFYLYDYFIQVSPSVMTTQLMQHFAIGAAKLGLLSACFYYTYLVMQIPVGMLVDRFGSRKLLTFSVLISALGIMAFTITHNLYIAGLARAVIGLGSSFAFICALSLIANWYHHRHFAIWAGVVQMGACIGSIFGLAPLAQAVTRFGWQQCLWVIGITTLILAVIYWLVIQDQPPGKIKQQPENDQQLSKLKTILNHSQVWVIAFLSGCSWVPLGIIGALWGVPYLSKVYDLTTTQAGTLCSLYWIGLAIASPMIGWLSDTIRQRKLPCIICFTCGVISAIGLLLSPYLSMMFTALFLFFLGVASGAQSLSFAILKDNVQPTHFATASGFNNTAVICGSGIAQPLFGYLLYLGWDGKMHHHLPSYTISDYQHGLIILPAVMILALLAAVFLLKETQANNRYLTA